MVRSSSKNAEGGITLGQSGPYRKQTLLGTYIDHGRSSSDSYQQSYQQSYQDGLTNNSSNNGGVGVGGLDGPSGASSSMPMELTEMERELAYKIRGHVKKGGRKDQRRYLWTNLGDTLKGDSRTPVKLVPKAKLRHSESEEDVERREQEYKLIKRKLSRGHSYPPAHTAHTAHSQSNGNGNKEEGSEDGRSVPPPQTMASIGAVFSLGGGGGISIGSNGYNGSNGSSNGESSNSLVFWIGCLFAVVSGMVYPALAFLFSNSFSDLSNAGMDMSPIIDIVQWFLILGAVAFVSATIQNAALEWHSSRVSRQFALQWFDCLLRQDAAFYDVYAGPDQHDQHEGGGIFRVLAGSSQLKHAVGKKFGEGVQFFTCTLGGIAFAFYSDWMVSLVVLALLPFVSMATLSVMRYNQGRTAFATQSYASAGEVAHSTLANLRTILSLNAVTTRIKQYQKMTLNAQRFATTSLWKEGLANGAMIGSFISLYAVLTVYGSWLIYRDITDTKVDNDGILRMVGCDPSDAIPMIETCRHSGSSVFGALLGVAFAAQGMSQIANFLEALSEARSSIYPALQAMERLQAGKRKNTKQVLTKVTFPDGSVMIRPTMDQDLTPEEKQIIYHSTHNQQKLYKSSPRKNANNNNNLTNNNNNIVNGNTPVKTISEVDVIVNNDKDNDNTEEDHDQVPNEDEMDIVDIESNINNTNNNNTNNTNNKPKSESDISFSSSIQTSSRYQKSLYKMNVVVLPRYTINPSSSRKGHKPKPHTVQGHICFDNVRFAYPTRPSQWALDGFSLKIEGGTTVAIVGPSGSGKSTVVALLERFYDPQGGTVSIDGVDLRAWNVGHLRQHTLGLVGQEPQLFNTTLRHNLCLGHNNSHTHNSHSYNESSMIAAATKANVHHIIQTFPQGYDTHVGDGGAQLSGGQKQRIAIARVLIRRPSILLLDEATSALDSESELLVQESIDQLLQTHHKQPQKQHNNNINDKNNTNDNDTNDTKQMTMVVVAHRLSTIRNADTIVYMEKGKVVEMGSHDKLMKINRGKYRKMVQIQTMAEELAHEEKQQQQQQQQQQQSSVQQLQQQPSQRNIFGIPIGDNNEEKKKEKPKSQRNLFGIGDDNNEDMENKKKKGDPQSKEVNITFDNTNDKVNNNNNNNKDNDKNSKDNNNNNDDEEGQCMIKFDHVHFAYPSRPEVMVLEDFCLSICRGETMALVGPSGGGKSTTIALLERFYDPLKGSVYFDGRRIKKLNVRWLREKIGLVGQEPVLFDGSVRTNIALGRPEGTVTTADIVHAAKLAHAHNFIAQELPHGYDTPVGTSTLSGGQKQRIAIARAVVKQPPVLLLDEATSALDSESEKAVQAALDELVMNQPSPSKSQSQSQSIPSSSSPQSQSRSQPSSYSLGAYTYTGKPTVVIVAHRLTTIRAADRIAYIAEGKVQELGTHKELMSRRNGRYRRMVETQRRSAEIDTDKLAPSSSKLTMTTTTTPTTTTTTTTSTISSDTKSSNRKKYKKQNRDSTSTSNTGTSSNSSKDSSASIRWIRKLARKDTKFYVMGAIGMAFTGAVFPTWGVMFGKMIDMLFQPVFPCDETNLSLSPELYGESATTCEEYYQQVANDMRSRSFLLAISWGAIVVMALLGNLLVYTGFQTASERINKRIRDEAFQALCRQEPAYFDVRSVHDVTTLLEKDASKIQSFLGQPIRTFFLNLSSVVTGLIISFFYMWPFALLSLAVIPLMAVATTIEMKMMLGKDTTTDETNTNTSTSTSTSKHPPLSAGGIVSETLQHMRTVASLHLESQRYRALSEALARDQDSDWSRGLKLGLTKGLSVLVQQYVNALQFWWGGYLLNKSGDRYTFQDFLISMFALLFALFALGAASIDATDRGDAKDAAQRLYVLVHRQSKIDPLDKRGRVGKTASKRRLLLQQQQKHAGSTRTLGSNVSSGLMSGAME